MSNTIDNILQHNNEGVKSLCRGRFIAAKSSFRAALVGLNKLEIKLGEQDQENPSSKPKTCPLVIETRTLPNLRRKDDDSQYFICRDALLLSNHDPDADYGSLYPIIGAGLIGIVVFNLSLTSHYHEYLNSGGATNLKNVVRTYSKVWDALNNDSFLLKEYHPIQKEKMMLATLNNMGIIFHKLENYSKAKRCFSTLKLICSQKTAGVQSLQRDVRYGMAMNALFADQPSPACAA
mmetsp:Transcript_20841/g.30850  ORF Transcript_20841/g.30850 Transcript_20841/m.30850 type:complete len:235 (+) Transcript_20841:58-762(+)